MSRVLVALAVLGAACASAPPAGPALEAPAPQEASGPEFVLTVYPHVVLWHPNQRRQVTARVRISNPGPDWYCPEVLFEWAPGHTSGLAADCPPFDERSPEEQRAPFLCSRSVCCYPPGDWVIRVRVRQGGRERVLARPVVVRG